MLREPARAGSAVHDVPGGPDRALPDRHRLPPRDLSPDLALLSGHISDVLSELNALRCSQLCFSGPVESEQDVDIERRERRLHFAPLEAGFSQTNIYYELSTGRAVGATVEISRSEAPVLSVGHVASAILFAVGLSSPTSAVDSVLASPETLRGPTSLDEAALCALYGNPGYCAEDDGLR